MQKAVCVSIIARSKTVFSNSLKYGLSILLAATSLTACRFGEKHTSPETYKMLTFNDGGVKEANMAVIAYTNGNFADADRYVQASLDDNKQNAQALLVGALIAERSDSPNKARQYYEEIIKYNGNDISVLGTTGSEPQKITDIASKRLRQLNLSQNQLIIEDNFGNKVFNLSNKASATNATTAMEEALFVRLQKNGEKTSAQAEADRNAIEVLFSDEEKNTISRFIILKELAENDLITKEEFLRARQSNIGGLLPLTQTPASAQVVKPVPTASIIVDRINVLKSAVEDRAITPREYSAERNLIVEAVLPPYPTERLKKKTPAKDIISAAKDLRKLEVIYDLGLITTSEKTKEQKAIEHNLGLTDKSSSNTQTVTTQQVVSSPVQITAPQVKEEITITVPAESKEVITTTVETIQANKPTEDITPLIPDVSSPFNK